jgi:hypothetical protein
MACPKRLSAVLLLALAGCGDAQPATHPRAAATPAATPGPCVEAARTQIDGARTRVTGVSPGFATCVYESPGVRADVMVDTNPQALVRFNRAAVERGQNAAWTHTKAKAPQRVEGLGAGADWFPADHELLTTDGKRLISVKFVKAGDRKLAVSLARATLSG